MCRGDAALALNEGLPTSEGFWLNYFHYYILQRTDNMNATMDQCSRCLLMFPTEEVNGTECLTCRVPCPGCGERCATWYLDCHNGLCVNCDMIRGGYIKNK